MEMGKGGEGREGGRQGAATPPLSARATPLAEATPLRGHKPRLLFGEPRPPPARPRPHWEVTPVYQPGHALLWRPRPCPRRPRPYVSLSPAPLRGAPRREARPSVSRSHAPVRGGHAPVARSPALPVPRAPGFLPKLRGADYGDRSPPQSHPSRKQERSLGPAHCPVKPRPLPS